jgi:hypothetical protein
MKNWIIRTFSLKGSWNWAKKQMLNGYTLKHKGISGAMEIAIDDPDNKRLVWRFGKNDNWGSANHFLSDEIITTYYITGYKDMEEEFKTNNPETCIKCGEDLVTCEDCEKKGCPECDKGWRNDWYMDEDGIWFCPECHIKLEEEYKRDTENGTKICGTCYYSSDIDNDGNEMDDHECFCSDTEEVFCKREYCNKWKNIE